MPESKYRFTKVEDARGGYSVADRDRHLAPLGRIFKNQRSYNLRRFIRITGWSAIDTNAKTLGSRGEATIYRTRELAAKALEDRRFPNGRT